MFSGMRAMTGGWRIKARIILKERISGSMRLTDF
jgi:hypothetical protein